MRITVALAIVAAIPGLAGAPALAQSSLDARPAYQWSDRKLPKAVTGQERRYLLAKVCSLTGGSTNCVTAVSITNLMPQACNVGVEFYYPNIGEAPACAITYNSLPPRNQTTICSRSMGTFGFCNATCDLPLINVYGYGYIYSNCARFAVQATMYLKDSTDTAIVGAHDSQVIRLKLPPGNKANQGD